MSDDPSSSAPPRQGMNALQHAAFMTVRRAWHPLAAARAPGLHRYTLLVDVAAAQRRGAIFMLAVQRGDENPLSLANAIITGAETRPHVLVSVLKGGQAVIEYRGDWEGFKGAKVPALQTVRLDEKDSAPLRVLYQRLVEGALRLLENDFPGRADKVYIAAARAYEEKEKTALAQHRRAAAGLVPDVSALPMSAAGSASARFGALWPVTATVVTYGAAALPFAARKKPPEPA